MSTAAREGMEGNEAIIGHPVVALAAKLGCTEGQLYTMVTALVIAVLLGLSTVHGASTAGSPGVGTGVSPPAAPAPALPPGATSGR